MNGLGNLSNLTNLGNLPKELLKDSDNLLILAIIFMLIKEKKDTNEEVNKPLLIALLSILMQK